MDNVAERRALALKSANPDVFSGVSPSFIVTIFTVLSQLFQNQCGKASAKSPKEVLQEDFDADGQYSRTTMNTVEHEVFKKYRSEGHKITHRDSRKQALLLMDDVRTAPDEDVSTFMAAMG